VKKNRNIARPALSPAELGLLGRPIAAVRCEAHAADWRSAAEAAEVFRCLRPSVFPACLLKHPRPCTSGVYTGISLAENTLAFFFIFLYSVCYFPLPMNRSMLRAASRHLQSATRRPVAAAPAGAPRSGPVRGYATAFNWEDPLVASELYTEEELAIQDTARQYCQERLLPRVLGKWQRERERECVCFVTLTRPLPRCVPKRGL
jgi:hypothetical protein